MEEQLTMTQLVEQELLSNNLVYALFQIDTDDWEYPLKEILDFTPDIKKSDVKTLDKHGLLSQEIKTELLEYCTVAEKITEGDHSYMGEFAYKLTFDEDLRDRVNKYMHIENGVVQTKHLNWVERSIAKELAYRLSTKKTIDIDSINERLERFEEVTGMELTENQREAVIQAVSKPISIITGKAGTGKSTIIAAIIAVLDTKPLLLSPTGKAASRIGETTGMEAYTIHSKVYKRDEVNETIIVDEFGMVDLRLFRSLLNMDYTSMVLIGDKEQLSPIGIGLPLQSLIESGLVPTIELTSVKRQSEDNGIINVANAILDEDHTKIQSNDHVDIIDPDDFDEDTLNKLIDDGADVFFSPFKNKQDNLSVKDLNISAAPMYRKKLGVPETGESITLLGCKLYENERIMNEKNDKTATEGLVANGQVGRFGGIYETVKVSRAYQSSTINFVYEDLKDETKIRRLPSGQIIPCYAMTVHKSQGSEYNNVCVAMKKYSYFITKDMLYTAVTRAKKKCTLVMSHDTIRRVIKNKRKVRRTRFIDMLKGLLARGE